MTRIIADTEMMAQVATQAQQQAAHLNTTLQQLSSAVGRLNRWEGASHYQFNNDWSSISRQLHDAANEIDHLGHCLQTTANNFRTTDEQSGAAWDGSGGGGADGNKGKDEGGYGFWDLVGNADTLADKYAEEKLGKDLGGLAAMWAQGGVAGMKDGALKDWLGGIADSKAFGPALGFVGGAAFEFLGRDHSKYGVIHDVNASLISSGLQAGAMLIPGVGEVLIANAAVQLGGGVATWGADFVADHFISDPGMRDAIKNDAAAVRGVLEKVNVDKVFQGAGDIAASGLDHVGQAAGDVGHAIGGWLFGSH